MSYRVSTQVYSGPFDLLLQLVSRQKVDIGSISISEVAEQYLAEVERLEALDLDVASDFLPSPYLLDIKAASLVPTIRPMSPKTMTWRRILRLGCRFLREVLIQRLIAYKQFNAAAALGARMEAEAACIRACCRPDPENLMPDYLRTARPCRHLRDGWQARDVPAFEPSMPPAACPSNSRLPLSTASRSRGPISRSAIFGWGCDHRADRRHVSRHSRSAALSRSSKTRTSAPSASTESRAPEYRPRDGSLFDEED
ncbi:MAG: segregation and condensation protein A [Collinsella intestinalis]